MRRLMLLGAPIAGAGLALFVACGGVGVGGSAPPDWVTCTVQETPDFEVDTAVAGAPTLLDLARGHTLDIPADAVPAGTEIRFRQMEGERVLVSVTATPANITVQPPAVLTLVYEGRECGIRSGSSLAIYREGPSEEPADMLPPPDTTPRAGHVAGLTDHFSLFAIAQ